MTGLPNGWIYLLSRRQLAELRELVGRERFGSEGFGASREWGPKVSVDLRSTGSIVARPVDGVWHYRVTLWGVRERDFGAELESTSATILASAREYIEETEKRQPVMPQDLFQRRFYFIRNEEGFEPAFSTGRITRDEAMRMIPGP